MAYLTHVGTRVGASDTLVTGISDLVSYDTDSGMRVAVISADGLWLQIRDPDNNMAQLQQVFIGDAEGLTAPGQLQLGLHDGQPALISYGPAGAPLTAHVLQANGRVSESVGLPGNAGRVSTFEKVEVGGKTLVFVAGQDRDGISCWEERPNGNWIFEGDMDLAEGFGRDVSDMTQITAHGQTWLATLSSAGNAVNLLKISPDGQVSLSHRLDAQDGLPIATPTAVETVEMGGKTYLLVAAAGTSSISVLRLEANGTMSMIDQVGDDLNTRFQSLTQLEVIEAEGRVYVIAGGADDGLSLLTMLPNGHLIHLETLADSNDMALTNVTGLSTSIDNGMLRIFASAQGGFEVTELAVRLSDIGRISKASGNTLDLTGSSDDDILVGNGSSNKLYGMGGRDILIDGKGEDRLNGGNGADIFVFEADGRRDIIEDFRLGQDTIDLSGMGRAYSLDAFRFQSMSNGVKIFFQDEELRIFSHNGTRLEKDDFELTDLMGMWHIDTGDVTQEAQDLFGSLADDVLQGGTGDDTLRGEVVNATFDDPAGQVFRIYGATLDRTPDRAGHETWTQRLISGEQDLLGVISGFVESNEFQRTYGATDNEEFVTLLYNNVLDRDPDPGGLAFWAGHLNGGTRTREEVVRGFSESGEFKNTTEGASLDMSAAGYHAAMIDDVFRLYRATLDRNPDKAGLLDWSGRLAGDWAYTDVAAGFVNSGEFQRTYGNASNAEFITLLYNNVLDRDPDTGGMANWMGHLSEGTRTREEVVRGFAQSAEFIRGTQDDLTTYLRGLGENDRLEGGSGSDLLYGGALSDTFVFAAFDGGDHRVADLEAWDTVELQGFEFADITEALAQFEQVGRDVVFEDQGVSVTFENVTLGEVTQEMISLF